ncbi:hypothetical protein TWF506_010285 [Arthrobotrys conoides]|uniref:Uncharacterized protein n=1 Tax=Arthrobotrys conoides TaxID=74498 RepID=A0AAN8RS67_9PEZI
MEVGNPDSDIEADYIHHFIAILRKHGHPIVLTEVSALRYMGVRVPLSDIDFLIKDSQFDSILVDIQASELFEKVDQNPGPRLGDEYVLNLVPRFFSKPTRMDPNFINLWSETVYKLKIDDAELIKVEGITVLNPHILDGRFTQIIETENLSPEKLDSRGTPTIPEFCHGNVQIFIPSIPTMCNALLNQAVYHSENYEKITNRPIYQLENMIRYLYLDNPTHRDILLPLLGPRNQAMEELIRNYKRKPRVIFERGADGEVTVRSQHYIAS